MWSGVRELALGSPGNLTIKVPSPALKRENMRSRMAKWCTDLSRYRDERFSFWVLCKPTDKKERSP